MLAVRGAVRMALERERGNRAHPLADATAKITVAFPTNCDVPRPWLSAGTNGADSFLDAILRHTTPRFERATLATRSQD
jgi:hypothetical protein